MVAVTDSAQRVYRGASAAVRQEHRRALLLDAAYTLIAESGVASVTLRAVTRSAGVGSRYLYESFDSCDALVLAVYDWQLSELLDRFKAAAAGSPDDLAARIRANVEVAVTFLTEDERRRGLMTEIESTPGLRERRRQMIRAVAETMVTQVEPLLTGDSIPRQWLFLRAHIIAAGCTDLAVEWMRGAIELTEKQFVQALLAMLFSAVTEPVFDQTSAPTG